MLQPVSLFIGMRYAKLAKGNGFISFISFFSIAGIALGMIALICVTSVMNGFENRLKSTMLKTLPHLTVLISDDNHTVLDQINSSNLVLLSNPFIEQAGLIISEQKLQAVKFYGVDKDIVTPLQHILTKQQLAGLTEHKYSVLLPRRLASELNVLPGDQVRLMLPSISSYTPMGRMPSQRLFTVAALIDSEELQTQMVVTSNQSLLRLSRIKREQFNTYGVYLKDPFDLEKLEATIPAIKDIKLTDWKVSQGALFSAVAMEKRIMSLLLGLIILVAVFNILSALTMMVSEKRSEIAILQTLGLTPNGVLQVFMVQGVFNGIVGSILGASLGVLFSYYINEILSSFGIQLLAGMHLPVDISFLQVFVIFMFSIFMSYLATFYPARRAASLAPAQVLRYE